MSEKTPAASFVDLRVWQKTHALTLSVYSLTGTFPKHELFGLTSQMRRAAVSVPANIAEGFKRRGRLDKVRFLNIAAASLAELRYYLILQRIWAICRPDRKRRNSMKLRGCFQRTSGLSFGRREHPRCERSSQLPCSVFCILCSD